MRKIKIYTLSDENGVKYVGKTKNLKQRYYRHIYDAKNKIKLNKRDAWVKSLLNENKKPIMFVIDEVCESEWEFWEVYWIEQFKVWGFDLKNMTKGGEGTYGRIVSDITKHKMSLAKKGKTPKNIKLLIRTVKGKSKSVIQYNMDGRIINEFDSINNAEIMTGISNIRKVVKRKRNSAGGYIWRYSHEKLTSSELIEIKSRLNKQQKKPILQFDKEGNLIKEWDSVNNVKKKYKHINAVLSGKRKTAGGYVWKYKL